MELKPTPPKLAKLKLELSIAILHKQSTRSSYLIKRFLFLKCSLFLNSNLVEKSLIKHARSFIKQSKLK